MGLHVEWIGAAEKQRRRREEAAEKQQRRREEAGEYEQHRPSVKRVGGNRASHHDNDKRNGDGNERNKRSCNRGSAARSAKCEAARDVEQQNRDERKARKRHV